MEKIKVPMITVLVMMVALVVALQVIRPAKGEGGEKTLVKIPRSFGDWHGEDYEMSEKARNELKPDEYMARVYTNSRGEQIDFTIIAGSHTGSFHNPQVCFRASNWEFAENRDDVLEIPDLKKKIPTHFVQVVATDNSNEKAIGCYFYRTPLGTRADTTTARVLLLLAKVAGIRERAYFVRFLLIHPSGDEQHDMSVLKSFMTDALSKMKETNPEIISS